MDDQYSEYEPTSRNKIDNIRAELVKRERLAGWILTETSWKTQTVIRKHKAINNIFIT